MCVFSAVKAINDADIVVRCVKNTFALLETTANAEVLLERLESFLDPLVPTEHTSFPPPMSSVSFESPCSLLTAYRSSRAAFHSYNELTHDSRSAQQRRCARLKSRAAAKRPFMLAFISIMQVVKIPFARSSSTFVAVQRARFERPPGRLPRFF